MTNEKQNEVSENKEIPHEINSVSDLSQILQTLGEPKEGHTRFFRGHGDEGWQMLPSIYRETYLIENEDKIIKDALTYCPDDFAPSDTLFEKLVKLQHYGYSTRLLDLTTNALVALYFALGDKKDGEIIILDIPNEQVKYWDSDTVAILSAISLQTTNFSILDFIKNKEYLQDEAIKNYMIQRINNAIKINSTESNLERSKHFHDSIKFINEKGVYIKNYILDIFNREPYAISLLHDIQTDKPSFRPVINSDDLQRVLCVRAKLNNARISRQQGCFLLFGINDDKLKPAVIPDEWQRFASNSQKILVKAENKAAIMQELKSFGISKRTLFPELEAQATEIMNLYKPKKNQMTPRHPQPLRHHQPCPALGHGHCHRLHVPPRRCLAPHRSGASPHSRAQSPRHPAPHTRLRPHLVGSRRRAAPARHQPYRPPGASRALPPHARRADHRPHPRCRHWP